MTANPRFDPTRNATELGSVTVPAFFMGGSGTGSTDPDTTKKFVWWDRLPWKRILLVTLAVVIVWKLAK